MRLHVMLPTLKKSSFATAILFLCLQPLTASADNFIDVYFGRANFADDTVSATFQNVSLLGAGQGFSVSKRVSYDTANVYGLRLGRWFEGYPFLGVAVDLSYFEAKGDDVTIEMIPLSVLLMVRYPLMVNRDYPGGRLHPYAAIGPAFITADFELDFSEFTKKVSSAGRGVGADFRAGLAWHLNQRLVIFGEYRHLRADLETTDDWRGIFVLTGSVDLVEAKADIRSSQFLGGLSFRF